MGNKRLVISVVANIIACLVNMGIGFFLTPYVVNNIGSDAYGFVSLANNFTSYASIITVALNSMAGRFITIEYERGNYKEANSYFTAVICGNIFMCIVLLFPAIICIAGMENFLDVPVNLLKDVQILFTFIFSAFFLTLLNAAFATSTFVANRKDIEAKRNIESYCLKAIILIILFQLLLPHVYYVGIATIATGTYILMMNIYYTKKLVPEFKISMANFQVKKVKTLIKSGVWNSVVRLSSSLSEGLDLLVANLFIGSQEMGMLAVAKTLPGVISTLIGTVSGVFVPNYTIAYARNDKEELIFKMRQSMMILSIISNICLTVLVVVGKEFYQLWVPEENSNFLQILSILTIAGLSINGGVQCVYNIFTVTNKLKVVSVVSVLCSFLNIIIVVILLRVTQLGVFAIAGVSTVLLILRSILFSIPYAARCIDVSIKIFLQPILSNFFVLVICSAIGSLVKMLFTLDNWINLIIYAGILCIFVAAINVLFALSREEKKALYETIMRKLK